MRIELWCLQQIPDIDKCIICQRSSLLPNSGTSHNLKVLAGSTDQENIIERLGRQAVAILSFEPAVLQDLNIKCLASKSTAANSDSAESKGLFQCIVRSKSTSRPEPADHCEIYNNQHIRETYDVLVQHGPFVRVICAFLLPVYSASSLFSVKLAIRVM